MTVNMALLERSFYRYINAVAEIKRNREVKFLPLFRPVEPYIEKNAAIVGFRR